MAELAYSADCDNTQDIGSLANSNVGRVYLSNFTTEVVESSGVLPLGAYPTVITNGAVSYSIGSSVALTKQLNITGAAYPNCVECPTAYKDLVQGSPDAPCFRMDTPGAFKFRWAADTGAHTIAIKVKQVANQSPRPTLTVLPNPAVGIADPIVTAAPSGTDWVMIGPVSVTFTAAGVVWIELRNWLNTQFGTTPCYWDDRVTS